MGKPRIVIVDTDEQYIASLLQKFVSSFFDKADIEIITEKSYIDTLFSKPQKIDILVIGEELYDPFINKHNIAYTFLMTEEQAENVIEDHSIHRIYKYTNLKEIYNEIIGISGETLRTKTQLKKKTQTILLYSACGGAGKTTIAVGIAACLSQNHKRVLYLSAEYIQDFQYFLENKSSISDGIVSKFQMGNPNLYAEMQSYIRREAFEYVPPFHAAISAYNIDFGVFAFLVEQIKKTNDYDFIIIDTDSTFSDDKGDLLDQVDKVMIVTQANSHAVFKTNKLLQNINYSDNEKFIFLCNAYQKENENSAIASSGFLVNEYINWIPECDRMKPDDLARVEGLQKIAYSLL